MAVKLKLKVPSSESKTKESNDDERSVTSTPKIKIKPPSSSGQSKESLVLSIGKKKVKVGKEKANKIKLSLKNKVPSDSMDLGTQPMKIVPKVRVKPTRIPGEGYDSEAPNLEDDPLLEQGIVIRFLNDSKLDFVQNAVDSGDLSGINIKWVAKDKAVVNIKGTFYSARLVDLPTITELYKTVDKKNIFKTLDVWQMLLILKEVIPNELSIDKDFELDSDNLYTHPLYNMTPKNELKPSKLVYRDGLTSPYENVFRRFRPRKVNHRVLNDIDSRVNELIKLDNEAEETHFEIVDLNKDSSSKFTSLSATPSTANSPQVFNTAFDRDEESMIVNDDVIESDLEEELAKALANDGEIEIEEGGVDLEDQNTAIEEDIEVAAEEEEDEEEEDEEDEEEEEEDDDDDEEEENKADKQHAKMLEEEIADLEKVVEVHRRGLASATHKMMKMKFQTSYNTLKNSLDAKKRELSKMINEQSDKINPNFYPQPSAQRQEAEEEEEEEEEEDDDDEEEEADHNNNEDLQGHEGQDDDIDDLF